MNALLRLLLFASLLYPASASAQLLPSELNLSSRAQHPDVRRATLWTYPANDHGAVAFSRSRTSTIRWAVIGAGIGAIVGLGAYAIVEGQGPDFCSEGEPGCTSQRSYSRRGFVLSFAAIGAVAGAVLGARSSPQAATH